MMIPSCIIVCLILLMTIHATTQTQQTTTQEDTSITPFILSIPSSEIDDLYVRLKLGVNRMTFATWQGQGELDWSYGTNAAYLSTLVDHWIHKYNWTTSQTRINRMNQYTTVIDGVRIHFVHIRSTASTSQTYPMLMSHGWPGSFLECEKILPLLTAAANDTDIAFHLVCPSIPGYAFSQQATKPGMDARNVAHIFHKLMIRLNYNQYFVQGGDWGSVIGTQMSLLYPSHVMGLHINFLAIPAPVLKGWWARIKTIFGLLALDWVYEEREAKMIKNTPVDVLSNFGYMAIQATKPQTLGYALNDSPISLASWLLEKFHAWTDLRAVNGDLSQIYTHDQLLDHIMIYWVSGCITSSMRLYYETFHSWSTWETARTGYVTVPTAVAEFNDIVYIPRSWAEAYYNIVQWNYHPQGGHFAALEEPQALVHDFKTFVHSVRNTNNNNKQTETETKPDL